MTRLTKTLLATTCLTLLAAGPAGAFAVNETNDAGNAVFPGEILDLGVTEVFGTLGKDDTDNFKWSGLAPGAAFTFSIFGDLTLSLNSLSKDAQFTALSAAETELVKIVDAPGPGSGTNPVILSSTIPGDGMLILRLFDSVGGNQITGPEGYRVTLDAPLAEVSEPAAIALFGFGLAGLAGARRRRVN